MGSAAVLRRSAERTLCDPWTAGPQAPLSMRFSRQEHWSGSPCPPPGDLPNPEIKPRSPALQADSLPAEPAGKPMSSGVGSLSLLQEIFLTQESNQSLLQDQTSSSFSRGHSPSETLLTNAGTRNNKPIWTKIKLPGFRNKRLLHAQCTQTRLRE